MPRFPILLHDDIPLLLVSGYMLAGLDEPPERHVKYFREEGQLRSKLLSPTNAPLSLLKAWETNAGFLYEKKGYNLQRGRLLIVNQLLRMLDSVYHRDTNRFGNKFWAESDFEVQWNPIENEIDELDIRWNPEKALYTFKDGSRLPEPIQKHYRRHIWKIDGLNGEAELIVERINTVYVSVNLKWSGKAKNRMPPFDLRVFAVNNEAKALAQLNPGSVSGGGEDEFFSTQYFQVELAEGTNLQARITIGKLEQVSPMYTP